MIEVKHENTPARPKLGPGSVINHMTTDGLFLILSIVDEHQVLCVQLTGDTACTSRFVFSQHQLVRFTGTLEVS